MLSHFQAAYNYVYIKQDCTRDLFSSGMLHSVECFCIDEMGQLSVPSPRVMEFKNVKV
jgi:hypothetical protein